MDKIAASPAHPGADKDPVCQLWAQYRRAFSWVGNEHGFRRMEYPAVQGKTFYGRLIVLPPGQASAAASRDGDTVYLSVSGDVEFTLDGALYAVGNRDLLAIPANTEFSYVNVGLENVILCGLFAAPDAAAAPGQIEHMAWEKYRRDFRWTLPLAELWGYHRGSGPLIRPPGLRGHTVRMPGGQSTPWHYAPRDLMFMPVDGAVEFGAAGKLWPLQRFDMLLIPAFTPYNYTNYGFEEVFFLSIGGKLEPGKKGVYFRSDPGWPIRADAPTMTVEIDVYGDAKVIG